MKYDGRRAVPDLWDEMQKHAGGVQNLYFGVADRVDDGLWGLFINNRITDLIVYAPIKQINACQSLEELLELYETEYAIQRITGN